MKEREEEGDEGYCDSCGQPLDKYSITDVCESCHEGDGDGEDWVPARIECNNDGTWDVVNDDTGEYMGTGFATEDAAMQHALAHDCCIVGTTDNDKE